MDLRPAVAPGELATWWQARFEAQLPAAADWLTAAERGWAAGLRYTKRRTDFLLSRWNLKLAVARVLGWPQEPASLARIEVRPAAMTGDPEGGTGRRGAGAPVLYLDGQPTGRGLSLSDRAGCAICLVADRDVRLGCDIELAEPRSDAFVRDYLTEAERQLVAGAGAGRDTIANLVWSAKESALKVLGTGLRRDTRSVEVTVADPRPPERTWSPLRVRTAEGEVFPGWWRRSGDFLVTACWAGDGPPPAALEPESPLDSQPPTHRWLDRPLA